MVSIAELESDPQTAQVARRLRVDERCVIASRIEMKARAVLRDNTLQSEAVARALFELARELRDA